MSSATEVTNARFQTTVKRIPFSGVDGRKKGKVPPSEFLEVFRAFMEAKGCAEAMDTDLVKKHEDSKDKNSKEVVDDLKKDSQVRICYKTSCEGTPFALIRKCESAYEMTQVLKNRYDPSDIKDVVELTKKLETCNFKQLEADPTNFLLEVENINSLLASIGTEHAKPEQQLRLSILARLPKERYKLVIRDLTKRIEKAESIPWAEFQDEIYKHWKNYVRKDVNDGYRKPEDERSPRGGGYRKIRNRGRFPVRTTALNVNPTGHKKYGKSPKTAYKWYNG